MTPGIEHQDYDLKIAKLIERFSPCERRITICVAFEKGDGIANMAFFQLLYC